ncbi:hypothetical protein ACU81Q_03210 [Komagataeibacter melomenusus]
MSAQGTDLRGLDIAQPVLDDMRRHVCRFGLILHTSAHARLALLWQRNHHEAGLKSGGPTDGLFHDRNMRADNSEILFSISDALLNTRKNWQETRNYMFQNRNQLISDN